MVKCDAGNLGMLLTAIVTMLVLVICWLLLSPLELKIDTRIPLISLHWKTIAKVRMEFEGGEWWLKFSSFPYNHKWLFTELFSKRKGRIKKIQLTVAKKSKERNVPLKKIYGVIASSKVLTWQLAMDTSDYCMNARLYPLVFLPGMQGHLHINFSNRNFLVLHILQSPGRVLWTWLK